MKQYNDLAGKVIKTLSLHDDGPYGPEIQIEFTDGTCFHSCIKPAYTLEARLVENTAGGTEVLKDFSTQSG